MATFFQKFIDYFQADNDIVVDRLKKCRDCEFITPRFRCTKCGCFMKLKTKIAGSRCPINKW
jgi:hypothetical protein